MKTWTFERGAKHRNKMHNSMTYRIIGKCAIFRETVVCRVCPVCPDPQVEMDTPERREIEETRDLPYVNSPRFRFNEDNIFRDLVDQMERSEWLATRESGLSERKEIP